MKGIVFDVRRFSTHDGNGLRTTVFMKGCPLRCVWCQNPEGISAGIHPIYFESQCIHCGTCLRYSNGKGLEEKCGQIILHREEQDHWEKIADACPAEAIRMDARIYTVEELVNEVMKDEVFFAHGGGVTFSGGEPLMQSEFIGEVMKELQDCGVHTAIETSLAVPERALDNVLPYLNQIYADIKIYDNDRHLKYTGASNTLVKKNLQRILVSDQKDLLTVRTPLIPLYTAYEENLAQIAEFLYENYENVRYELLNYNPMAEAKYHLVDREYCFEENPPLYSREQMNEFGDIVKNHGIKNLIMAL